MASRARRSWASRRAWPRSSSASGPSGTDASASSEGSGSGRVPSSSAVPRWSGGIDASASDGLPTSGSTKDCHTATPNSSVAATSTAPGPASASPAPTGATTPPASTPTWASRALAVTRATAFSSAWGSSAERLMPCTRDSTISTNASGNSQKESASSTSAAAATRRSSEAAMRVNRSAPGRSITQPSSGPMTANGAMVISRYSATLPRASLEGTEKNSVLASAMATRVSPAVEAAWALARIRNAGPPAPKRSDTRVATALPAREATRRPGLRSDRSFQRRASCSEGSSMSPPGP